MKTLFIFGICLLFSFFADRSEVMAGCNLVPVSLEERVKNSSLIISGVVLEKRCEWYEQNIYTIYRVHPEKVFSERHNSLVPSYLEIYIPGGQIGNTLHRLDPSFEISVFTQGYFFLVPFQKSVNIISGNIVAQKWTPYAYKQGFIQTDAKNNQVRDLFFDYTDEKELIRSIQKIKPESHLNLLNYLTDEEEVRLTRLYNQFREKSTLNKSELKKTHEVETIFSSFISSFSPSSVNGGVGDVVTVRGSGFGQRNFLTGIGLPKADDGGRSINFVRSADILFWSDTEVRFRVGSGMGTGSITLYTSVGQALRSSVLTINYSLINYSSQTGNAVQPADWFNRNGAGGYSFSYNQSFFNNSAAVASFNRALESWRCNTLCNLGINTGSVSASCSADDGINLVSFNNNCGGSWSGVLAVTYNRADGCSDGRGNTIFQIREFDILFGNTIAWNYGPGATPQGQTDFESVALHEIGHCLQLGHVIDPSRVMHFALGTQTDKRTLENPSAIAGAGAQLNRSAGRTACNRNAYQSIGANACRLSGSSGTAPTANFTSNVTSGCSPLTVSFSDLSTGNPSLWQWDADGNGTVDYTTRNCSHTYFTPGTYTVRLTVSNGFGSAQSVRVSYITVNSSANINLSVSPAAVTVCSGGNVTLAASGADSYTWINANTGAFLGSGSVLNFTPNQSTTINVTGNRNGCSTIRSVSIIIQNNLNISTAPVNPSAGLANGSISVNVSGGRAPFRYSLNNNSFQNSSVFSGLRAGTYTVRAEDAVGCGQNVNITLTETSSGNTGNCLTAPVLSVTNVTASSVTFNWNSLSGVSSYILMYRPIGGGWTTVTVFQNSLFINGLTANTSYEGFVRAVCVSGNQSPFSNAAGFRTLGSTGGGNETCNVPLGINVSPGISTLALTWLPVSGASSYRVYWRLRGTSSWTSVTVFTTNLTITSLFSNSDYELQLQAVCGTGSSVLSAIFAGKTLRARESAEFSSNSDYHINIYPNPTRDRITVRYDFNESSNMKLKIFNHIGKKVLTEKLTGTETEINLSGLSSGLYQCIFIADEQVMMSEKLMIE